MKFNLLGKALIAFCSTAAFAYANSAVVAFDRGLTADISGNFQEAIKQFSIAIKEDSNYAYAYNNRGVIYRSLGDHNKAIEDYNQAIKIDPTFAYAYYNRGLVYYNLGNKSKAIADFTQATKIDPNYRRLQPSARDRSELFRRLQ
ncbi:MAG: tetratricopeptide repeat protein [Helicobacteraceae bacterium]|jgi:tetratricopeptide (TPR) repeat protein|nr:tetratricopeptide repeat protein [Helicobacteraceae bacterium]